MHMYLVGSDVIPENTESACGIESFDPFQCLIKTIFNLM